MKKTKGKFGKNATATTIPHGEPMGATTIDTKAHGGGMGEYPVHPKGHPGEGFATHSRQHAAKSGKSGKFT